MNEPSFDDELLFIRIVAVFLLIAGVGFLLSRFF